MTLPDVVNLDDIRDLKARVDRLEDVVVFLAGAVDLPQTTPARDLIADLMEHADDPEQVAG